MGPLDPPHQARLLPSGRLGCKHKNTKKNSSASPPCKVQKGNFGVCFEQRFKKSVWKRDSGFFFQRHKKFPSAKRPKIFLAPGEGGPTPPPHSLNPCPSPGVGQISMLTFHNYNWGGGRRRGRNKGAEKGPRKAPIRPPAPRLPPPHHCLSHHLFSSASGLHAPTAAALARRRAVPGLGLLGDRRAEPPVEGVLAADAPPPFPALGRPWRPCWVAESAAAAGRGRETTKCRYPQRAHCTPSSCTTSAKDGKDTHGSQLGAVEFEEVLDLHFPEHPPPECIYDCSFCLKRAQH